MQLAKSITNESGEIADTGSGPARFSGHALPGLRSPGATHRGLCANEMPAHDDDGP